jgi:hypothetical protein
MQKEINSLLDIFNCMFKNKKDWAYISDADKEYYFFIINRYLSKKYPEKAQLFNIKNINKVVALDLWYFYLLDKPYPKWFWSKSKSNTSEEKISKSQYISLLKHLRIKNVDLDYLLDNNMDFVNEELKYIKLLQQELKK